MLKSKKKMALVLSLVLSLLVMMQISAFAYTFQFPTETGPSGTLTLIGSMKKSTVGPPNPGNMVTFQIKTENPKYNMDSYKIFGRVTLSGDTLEDTKSGGQGNQFTMSIRAGGAVLVSTTGKFYGYSKAFGNAYIQKSCTASQL